MNVYEINELLRKKKITFVSNTPFVVEKFEHDFEPDSPFWYEHIKCFTFGRNLSCLYCNGWEPIESNMGNALRYSNV